MVIFAFIEGLQNGLKHTYIVEGMYHSNSLKIKKSNFSTLFFPLWALKARRRDSNLEMKAPSFLSCQEGPHVLVRGVFCRRTFIFFPQFKMAFLSTHFSPTSVLGKITPEKGLNLYIFVDYVHSLQERIPFKSLKLSLGTVKDQVFSKNATWGSVLVFAEWLLGLAASAVINGAMPNLL